MFAPGLPASTPPVVAPALLLLEQLLLLLLLLLERKPPTEILATADQDRDKLYKFKDKIYKYTNTKLLLEHKTPRPKEVPTSNQALYQADQPSQLFSR